jgi:hypothetical protein
MTVARCQITKELLQLGMEVRSTLLKVTGDISIITLAGVLQKSFALVLQLPLGIRFIEECQDSCIRQSFDCGVYSTINTLPR